MTMNRLQAPPTKAVPNIDLPHAVEHVLDNGIKVYSISAGFQDLVKVEFLFTNLQFDPDHPLLDSAVNRMMQEGTKKYTAQQLADQIDYYGAFLETDENFDFCSINLFTLNKYLDQTLPFIAELIDYPVFPQNELNVYVRNFKQRLTVENEKVSSLARRHFSRMIFGEKHSYGYFTQPGDYDKLNRESLTDFHRRKYDPSNCVIIISGKVNESAIAVLNRIFGKKKSAAKPAIAQPVPFDSSSQKKHYFEKEGAIQSAIRIGMPFFNRCHPDYPAMTFVNTLLGGYFGSRLMSNIREDKGYTYGIGSAIVSMKQDGYFFISTEVGSEVTNQALKEIYSEIEVLKNELVESDELEMVRNYMLGTYLKGIDGAFQLAERFKSIYLSGLDYSYYRRYLDKIRTIGPEEVREYARKYFNAADFYEIVVGRK